MSMIRSVLWLTNTFTAPPTPAGTIAAFATTVPRNEFRVETTGCGTPVGQIVKYANAPEGFTVPGNVAPVGTTVMLNE